MFAFAVLMIYQFSLSCSDVSQIQRHSKHLWWFSEEDTLLVMLQEETQDVTTISAAHIRFVYK